jgi:hypothetical protein
MQNSTEGKRVHRIYPKKKDKAKKSEYPLRQSNLLAFFWNTRQTEKATRSKTEL